MSPSAEKRPAFLNGFKFSKGKGFTWPEYGTAAELEEVVSSIKEWFLDIMPNSCTKKTRKPATGTYTAVTRIPFGYGTIGDLQSWGELFQPGREGMFFVYICMAVWKVNGDRLGMVRDDYRRVLKDVQWVISEGLRRN